MGPLIYSYMDSHMDLHIGLHKGKMIPIPNGHRKLGIPMPMANLVIMARATFLQEEAYFRDGTGQLFHDPATVPSSGNASPPSGEN